MIKQYLLNTNKNTVVFILKKEIETKQDCKLYLGNAVTVTLEV